MTTDELSTPAVWCVDCNFWTRDDEPTPYEHHKRTGHLDFRYLRLVRDPQQLDVERLAQVLAFLEDPSLWDRAGDNLRGVYRDQAAAIAHAYATDPETPQPPTGAGG